MTDNEKLDLILAEMQEMNQKMDKLATEQAEMKKKLERLAVEQTKTQGELFKIDRKIENVYGVALEALADTAVNRNCLETGTGTLI